MSIQSLREELKDLPGAERLVMQYDEGGKAQIFYIDDIAVRLGPTATAREIRAAFLEARRPPAPIIKKARKKPRQKTSKKVAKKAPKRRKP